MPLSRLGRQIVEATAALNAIGARFALIGGLAEPTDRTASPRDSAGA
jgi:hypothetical protein